jgi:hypothetical protein
MAATTRWVKYDVDAVGSAGDGNGAKGLGTRGYSLGRGTVDADGVDIGPTTNRLYVSIDGEAVSGSYVTLYSGSGLDPRFVARDITEKLHASAPTDEKFANAVCLWEGQYWGTDPNINGENKFKIYSGTLGSSSSVTVAASGTYSAHTALGFGTKTETGGSASGNHDSADPYISVSGTYYGFFDEVYTILISTDNDATRGIDSATKSITYDGTMTLGGVFIGAADDTYTLTIDITNGTTMGAGTGNVPRMRWTSTNDSMAAGQYVELLYPDHWYSVGTMGVRVKFTDAVFGSGHWTIPVYTANYAEGTNAHAAIGTAEYVFSSNRGDDSASPVTTTSGYTALGTRGLSIKFSGSNELYAGDVFRVICAGVYPGSASNYDISSLNYGNVTVSTDSDVKSVIFEVVSGAVEVSTVKFGLQNHGSFSHHNEGNSDTYFRFGTVGPDNVKSGYEWYPNITYDDLNDDTPPAYLYAIDKNLSVVSTADNSESVGNTGLVSDPMWVCIHLGASETGANSTINYRLYFDYQ